MSNWLASHVSYELARKAKAPCLRCSIKKLTFFMILGLEGSGRVPGKQRPVSSPAAVALTCIKKICASTHASATELKHHILLACLLV